MARQSSSNGVASAINGGSYGVQLHGGIHVGNLAIVGRRNGAEAQQL